MSRPFDLPSHEQRGDLVLVSGRVESAHGGGAPAGGAGSVAVRAVRPPLAVGAPLQAYAVATHEPTREDERRAHMTLTLALPPAVARAAPRRVATFLAGRYCALAALRAAGATTPIHALDVRADGSPAWPAGFVGSITHTDDLAVAVVAPRESHAGIGIDCERRLGPGEAAELAPAVLPERARVAIRGAERAPELATLVSLAFSAKESLYKCVAPIAGEFFEFHEATLLELDVAGGAFRLRLDRDLAPGFARGMPFEGRFAIDGPVVCTIVELAAGR